MRHWIAHKLGHLSEETIITDRRSDSAHPSHTHTMRILLIWKKYANCFSSTLERVCKREWVGLTPRCFTQDGNRIGPDAKACSQCCDASSALSCKQETEVQKSIPNPFVMVYDKSESERERE